MRQAYVTLFKLGYAHTIEARIDGQLAGGLYGLAIGKMFYGESMFLLQTDASRIALAHLTPFRVTGIRPLPDEYPHLASLGAREIPRDAFIAQSA